MKPHMPIVSRRRQCALALTAAFAVSGCEGPVEPVELDARQVLATLFVETRGLGWSNSEHWATDAPLGTWFGVTTDSEGNVTELRLPGNWLNGRIPPELGMLESLQHLDFGMYYANVNWLTGPIPPELGNLRYLESLNLTSSGVTGPIPPELGNLRNLKTLRLALNDLTGPIPPEIGNLENLEDLSLYSNRLTGSIPPQNRQAPASRRPFSRVQRTGRPDTARVREPSEHRKSLAGGPSSPDRLDAA